MPRVPLGIIALAVFICGAAPLALSDQQSAPPPGQPADRIVAGLVARVAELEQKNRALEEQVRQLKGRLSLVSGEQIVPGSPQVPSTWKRGEINGLTFYVVPLEMKTPTTRPSK